MHSPRPALRRRHVLAAGASLLAAPHVLAQEWKPNGTVRIVVPYGAGGITDVAARKLLPLLSAALGQPVIIENKPGGNAIIGTQYVSSAAPDGRTILLTSAAHAVSPSLYKLPYDSEKDLVPITNFMNIETVLVVNSSVPVHSVQELVAYARANPGKLSNACGTPILHLIAGIMNHMGKMDITIVPYKGAGPSLQSAVAGETSMVVDPFTSLPHIRSGRLRPLAVLTETRSPYLPDVPTLKESGLPLTVDSWIGFMAPAGTPASIVNVFHREIVKALGSAELRETMTANNLRPGGLTPPQFAARISNEIAFWGRYVKEINFKAQ